MTRMMVDCRTIPSESNCSLAITGTADEVVRAAVQHSVDVHGHEDTAELREQVTRSMHEASESMAAPGSFVQLVEFTATPEQLEEGRTLVEKYQEEIGDTRTSRWGVFGADRDAEDTYVQIVAFPSYDDAMANSEHPATKELAAKMAELTTSSPTYRNLDVKEVRSNL